MTLPTTRSANATLKTFPQGAGIVNRALGARASGWPLATNLAQAEPGPDEADLCRDVRPPAYKHK
jgi:hypothetical protein